MESSINQTEFAHLEVPDPGLTDACVDATVSVLNKYFAGEELDDEDQALVTELLNQERIEEEVYNAIENEPFIISSQDIFLNERTDENKNRLILTEWYIYLSAWQGRDQDSTSNSQAA